MTASVSAPMASAADQKYVTAKTSVWWDIENCQVPDNRDPHTIAQNISSAPVEMNYCGPVSISAYGDTNRIPASVQHALSSTGIALNHVPADEEHVEMMIKIRSLFPYIIIVVSQILFRGARWLFGVWSFPTTFL
ncbi:hypothetical protein KPL71_021861 [Citrus sinensis]|uniref:Uncharacterized protein n=1 Tax=Citrus sinensis TaxID=2711 RepID=A0ACB8JI03_CITSI|nr:hypothetical protein KPL71_021861 [Citrus sinensis]